jgi:hypothetical protein
MCVCVCACASVCVRVGGDMEVTGIQNYGLHFI